VQRKWAYLETLFIGSDEVVKELPDSAARFREIDRTFQATCTRTNPTPNPDPDPNPNPNPNPIPSPNLNPNPNPYP